MTIPEFTAEASLGPTVGLYRGKVLFGNTRGAGVSPTQQSTAGSLLGFRPWQQQAHCCCFGSDGLLHCAYWWVPPWYDCETLRNVNCPSCQTCRPLGNKLL